MDKPIKVLYFVDRMLRGGIQSLVIDWVSRFDKKKIQVDFLLLDDGNEYELENTLKEMGCNVYKLKGVWIKTPADFIKESKALAVFFEKHHDYKVVHLHSSSKNYMVLKYAKKYGIPIRIAHSHSIDFQTKDILKKLIGNLLKSQLIRYSTDFFACSKIAGEWLFGKDIVNTNRFKIIHNAVDYNKFKFDSKKRKKIRKEFNVRDDEIVIGNVGRFITQKNHKFLIDIFNEYNKRCPNSKLLLVGTGALEDEMKIKVDELNLKDKVIFAGFRNDVNDIMQAIDIFLLPSLCEGLPVVGVEAQAAGLPVFTSEKVVTEELKITDNVYFISLDKTAKEWADIIYNSDIQRSDNYQVMKNEKYFIEDIIKELTCFYYN